MNENSRIIVYTPPPPPARVWMITLADLLSLLLTFFVLLFSMMEIPQQGWKESKSSLEETADAESPVTALIEGRDVPVASVITARGKDLDYLYHIIARQLKPETSAPVSYRMSADRLVISLASDVYFVPGAADIQTSAESLLHQLGGMLAHIPNRISLEGHTDPRPLKHAVFQDNWTLSIARADAVAHLLNESGVVSPLRIYGRADGAFHEIPADGTLQERYKKARRVDIIIHALEK